MHCSTAASNPIRKHDGSYGGAEMQTNAVVVSRYSARGIDGQVGQVGRHPGGLDCDREKAAEGAGCKGVCPQRKDDGDVEMSTLELEGMTMGAGRMKAASAACYGLKCGPNRCLAAHQTLGQRRKY